MSDLDTVYYPVYYRIVERRSNGWAFGKGKPFLNLCFKSPSTEELDHDFLWRSTKALPQRGRIGIFNRSYYESVLIVRVHPHMLQNERLPHSPGKKIWKQRFEDINNYEKYLTNNETVLESEAS